MAKKKSKKHIHSKQTTGKKDVDQATKKLQERARKIFREEFKPAISKSTLSTRLREGLDSDPVRLTRRISALAKCYSIVKERCTDLCPDEPGVFELEEDWIKQNVRPMPAYDCLEAHTHMALAAGIWILDELREYGYIFEASKYYPDLDEVFEKIESPDVQDPSHEEDALIGMQWLIEHRNDDCISTEKANIPMKELPGALSRCYMDLCTTKNEQHQEVPSRQQFDAILSLIPREDIEHAVQTFNELFWDFTERFYRSRRVFVEKEIKLYQRNLRHEERAKQFLTNIHEKLEARKNAPTAFPSPNINEMTEEFRKREMETKTLKLYAAELDKEEDALYDLEDQLFEERELFYDMVMEFNRLPREYLVESFGEEIADIWEDFSIDDPFSVSFAFLYLLDTGSDLPWLYGISFRLMTMCANTYPWYTCNFEQEAPGVWDHYDPEEKDYVFGHKKAILPKKIKMPEMDNWYAMVYKEDLDIEPRFQSRTNLAQIIYEITGCLMPRNLYRYESELETLYDYGITGVKATKPLLYCMGLLGETRHRSHIVDKDVFALLEKHEAAEPPQSPEDMQTKLLSLQAENELLRQAAYEAEKEARALKKQLSEQENHRKADRRELADLREMIFLLQTDDEQKDRIAEDISFPYSVQNRIVVFGGHDSWSREIRQKLPNVRFIDRTMLPNASLIRNADEVWIQSNAISHAYFYKIVDETRKHSIPLRYFSYASAIKCAEQIVLSDRENTG